MSATSGSEATTRSAAPAGLASTRVTATIRLASGEAMAVTPDEGGPLQGEALVVRTGDPDVVPLEAQPLELRRLPGDERAVGARQVLRAERVLGVVEACTRREAAAEEALEVGVAGVAAEAARAREDLAGHRIGADREAVEALAVPQPLHAHHR